MLIDVPAYYYAQHGADVTAQHPALSFQGWTETQVPLDPVRTAVVVMHSWKLPGTEQCPGLFKHLEYGSRADDSMENRFPAFLEAVRKSGIRLIHVAAGFEPQLQEFSGYHAVRKKYPPQGEPRITPTKQMLELKERHWHQSCSANADDYADIERSFRLRGFTILPRDNEEVVTASNQLFEICSENGIEHLIYTGFAVNACLTMSPCGFLDMVRRGFMCSVVGDLTTGVENKESCLTQANRNYGLWQFAMQGGYVFLSECLKETFAEL